MASSPGDSLHCEQCNRPLEPGAAGIGCLHCLLVEEISEETPAPRPPATAGAARFHHYKLLTREDGDPLELGRGAMGITYKAIDVNLHVPVALKVISPRYSAQPQARGRFLREARIAARLRHPNVATIHHFGTMDLDAGLADVPGESPDDATAASLAGSRCFYAMEFIEGETLEARLRRAGPLPPAAALEIALQVTRALEAAEQRGLVHRDLKPANIMLADEGGTTAVKVIDFGLAKAVSAAAGQGSELLLSSGPLTHDAFVGTPQFASPEQFDGGEVDVRSDVYSLGVTLWYALTGNAPYQGDTPAAVHDRQTHRPLPVAQLTDLDTPPCFVDLLTAMLAPDPARRPASATALRAEVEACLAAVRKDPLRMRRLKIAYVAILALIGAGALAVFFPWPHSPVPAAVADAAKSVAVLPFENRSAQPDTDYFAAGVQDEILSLLAKIRELKVISRHSVARYKQAPDDLPEVARQLGVANVVEGSVQKVGDRVRVNVQLIRADNGAQVWADSYNLKLDDLFGVESQVANGVADALAVHLTGAERGDVARQPTANPAAYDAYLRGLACTLKPGMNTSLIVAAQGHFGEAVRLDPDFALAWARLALVDTWGYDSGWIDVTPALRAAARDAAERALHLQPHLGEALLAMGYFQSVCQSDDDRALDFYQQAAAFLPNSSLLPQYRGEIAYNRGKFAEAFRQSDAAIRVDPRSSRLFSQRAKFFIASRRLPDALREYDRVLAIVPGDRDTRDNQAGVHLAMGDLAGAETLLAGLHPEPEEYNIFYDQTILAWLQRRPKTAVALLQGALAHRTEMKATSAASLRGFLGRSQQLAGDRAAAAATLHDARVELEALLATQPDNAYLTSDVARVCAALGDKPAALAAARRAIALMPSGKNKTSAPMMEDVLAEVAALVGENDLAIAHLQTLRRTLYQGNLVGQCPLNAAILRLFPNFDSLRGDPRFQALCGEDD